MNVPPTLPVRVARAERIAADIHLFELRAPDGGALPSWTAGSHIPVWSPNGSVRKYSLCNDPAETHRYEIAVKRDPAGRGGSVDLVDNVAAGDRLEIAAPHNAFDLAPKAPSFVFIAGGKLLDSVKKPEPAVAIGPYAAAARRRAVIGRSRPRRLPMGRALESRISRRID